MVVANPHCGDRGIPSTGCGKPAIAAAVGAQLAVARGIEPAGDRECPACAVKLGGILQL
jgi:hypothetical protein